MAGALPGQADLHVNSLLFSLDGEWALAHYEEGAYPIEEPGQLEDWTLEWIPAQVPGNVELDLLRAGKIEEPFYASNIRQLRAFENHTWWYRCKFKLPVDFRPAPGEQVELVFAGLDTLATLWVNQVKAGESANMLIEQRFDVTHFLRPGDENELVVRLDSALNAARRMHYEPGSMSWEHRFEGLHLRKAPHTWGWDITPRAVSAGIWRSVRLEIKPAVGFDWIYYWTVSTGSDGASLGARFQVRLPENSLKGWSVKFHGECRGQRFDYTWPLEFIADGCTIPIAEARLWWPAGMGAPDLYTVTAQLCHGENVLAERRERIGLRSLRIERTELAGQAWNTEPLDSVTGRFDRPPLPGSHFLIYINDQPVMIKGSNWVPLDAFHSRDAARLPQALALVEELGCNMIRCWGGNVYENDAFYDRCDELGVLVWQDFAFACCLYPQTESFLAQVQAEAQQVVPRLRNHACLALWCGDNENDMAYLSEGRDPGRNRLTRQVLPQVLERLDPQRHYIPSSPYVPPNLVGQPDAWQLTPEQHLWGPRGYFKSPFYTHHSAHFIGEIGYHGCPDPASVRQFISPENLWPPLENDEWQVHSVYHWQQRSIERDRIQLMLNQVRLFFAEVPEDLESFALASQIVQAEAKKFFIESTRLRKWATSGILWWNVIDGWPQFSDAVVDYYFRKKLAFEYIRRSQAPVCLVIGEPGTGEILPVVACNDTLQDAPLSWQVWLAAEDGADCKKALLARGEFLLPANQNWQVGRLPAHPSQQRLLLLQWEVNGQRFANHYLAGSPPFNLEQYRHWLTAIRGMA